VVALIYASATVVFLGYRLDRRAYGAIQAGLEERRAAVARDAAELGAPSAL
jgi:hypothetical protein